MGANCFDNIGKNPESCHNLGQYLCAKGSHFTENHLHCIRTPLIHSDLKLKDHFMKKKRNKFHSQEVCPSVLFVIFPCSVMNCHY